MPIYKNNIKYDFGYQIEDCQSLPYPNTIETLTLQNSKLNMDNSWLPYFAITDGAIKIGTPDFSGGGSRIWNHAINTVYFEPTDVPVKFWETGWTNLEAVEQLYIDNTNARWGASVDAGNAIRFGNTQYCSFIDKIHIVNSAITSNKYFPEGANIVNWVPNGDVRCGWVIGKTNVVLCGTNIQPDNLDTSYGMPLKIYHNADAILTRPFSEAGITCDIQLFEKEYTEWLDNYFTIAQNGTTLNWYEDAITNIYGKYVKLYNNNVVVGEIPYWKYDEITTEIGTNLTDSNVTKTGSITHAGTTKNYSITQTAYERTLKFRFNLNVFEEDDWTYNRFTIWPFLMWDWGNNNMYDLYYNETARFSQTLDMIKIIRYKKASDSNWTVWQKPTVQDLYDLAESLTHLPQETSLESVFTLEIPESGVYDIEIGYIETRDTRNSGQDTRPMIHDCMCAYKTDEGIRRIVNRNLENQQDGENPWLLALDMGDQYTQYVWGDAGLRVKEWGEYIWVDSFSCSNINKIYEYMGGLRDCNPLYKNVSYTNVYRNNGHYDWINQCTDSLFYNIPERQKGGSWFLSTAGNFTKLYLHPAIYALPNYGFDGTAEEWNNDVLQQFYDRGGQIYELPSNWKTLIPNYIGI